MSCKSNRPKMTVTIKPLTTYSDNINKRLDWIKYPLPTSTSIPKHWVKWLSTDVEVVPLPKSPV